MLTVPEAALRRQEVFKGQSYPSTRLDRQKKRIGSMLTVAVVHLKRRPVVCSMLVGFLLGLLRNPGVFDGACLTVAALLQHQEV